MTPPATSPAARTAAPPLRRPASPRRVSGPVRRTTRARPADAPPLLLRLVDHQLLDRLIRGRIWIGLIAFALMSIVTMQVTLLKLNRGIGAQIQRAQAISHENSLLGAHVSALEASERIQGLAAQHGMVPAPAGEVRYLRVGSGDALRAASSITAPRALPPSANAASAARNATAANGAGSPTGAGSATDPTAAGTGSSTSTVASGVPTGATTGAGGSSANASTSGSTAPGPTSDAAGSSTTDGASAGAPTTSSAHAAGAPGSSTDQGGPARRP